MMRAMLIAAALLASVHSTQAQVKARPTTDARADLTRTRGIWFSANGGRFHAGDPTKPAVLLIHGLHQSANSFLKPSAHPRGDRWYFNYSKKPESIRAEKEAPNAGIFKVGTSERVDVDPQNWFDFFKGQGFSVATWSQPGLSFDDAYPSAREAFRQLLVETTALNPTNPPPVVLIGHSRGGLIARKLLKEEGPQNRVTHLITLHSPHQGSSLADKTENMCEKMFSLFSTPGQEVEKKLLRAAGLHDDFRSLCTLLNSYIVDGESRELSPTGALISGLAAGEAAAPGVKYYTFGGTVPTFVRYYAWYLTANSAVPQYRVKNGLPRQYFIWEAHPREIPVVSPLFDVSAIVAPELQPGKGDGLVSEQSARLPFSTHFVTRLNHAEVLWDRALQRQVLGLINGATTPRLPGAIKR